MKEDLISRQAVQEMVDRIGGMYPYRQIGNRDSYSQYNEAWTDAINRVDAELNSLPSAQPEPCDDPRADVYYLAEKIGIHRLYALVVELRGEPELCEDAVSREAAIKCCTFGRTSLGLIDELRRLPSVTAKAEQPEYIPDTKAIPSEKDCVDLSERVTATFYDDENEEWSQKTVTIRDVLDSVCDEYTVLPSAQPERTCLNCGRTANNGGWYADGRTRCPIEEHYALPKDGYCHLWEKRNVTDDDYPERREE